jgi:hypothetical protein
VIKRVNFGIAPPGRRPHHHPLQPRYGDPAIPSLHDTLFIIADKYNIKPDTVLWGNPVLAGNPNTLSVGQVLNILPVDGALRIVQTGDTLDKIAKVFHSKVEDIINFPGNDIDPTDPQIKNGETVIIPGGWRDVTVWQLPVVHAPAAASGAAAASQKPKGLYRARRHLYLCLPANNHLSGNEYSPTIHPGIDIACLGAPDFRHRRRLFCRRACMAKGNLIIIDRQWLADGLWPLSQISIVCGGASTRDDSSAGGHRQFHRPAPALQRSDQYGRVNPWLYLGEVSLLALNPHIKRTAGPPPRPPSGRLVAAGEPVLCHTLLLSVLAAASGRAEFAWLCWLAAARSTPSRAAGGRASARPRHRRRPNGPGMRLPARQTATPAVAPAVAAVQIPTRGRSEW